MDYEIRWATVEDADGLGRLHAASWKAAYKGIIPDEVLDKINPERRAVYFQNALCNKTEETAVLVIEDKIIGMITLGKCRDEDSKTTDGEIWGIYLSPDYYRKGCGSILVTWGIQELRQRGYSSISLWVLEENWNAKSFYEKHGFTYDGTIKVLNIGRQLNEVRYKKIF